ncbi:DNA polymerase III subunit beta, partial [Bacillus velezensis]
TYNVDIPGKSLTELSKIHDDSQELVDIVNTETQVLFKAKNVLFFSRLLDGIYPDTTSFIPQVSISEIVVNTKEFLQAIVRASLLAREGRNNDVKLSANPAVSLEISSKTPAIGTEVE